MTPTPDYHRRFGGIERLYGAGLESIAELRYYREHFIK